MIDLVLAIVAALLWGGAYGAYFGPDLRRWWRRRQRRAVAWPPHQRFAQQPAPRPRPPPRPRPAAIPLKVLAPPPPVAVAQEPAPPSNVIPFPRRPRP